MKQTFTLTLRNDKSRFYKSFSVFILVINALAICLFLYYLPQNMPQRVGAIICVILAISSIVLKEKSGLRRYNDSGVSMVLIAIALYWFWIGYWMPSLVMILLTFLYRLANQPLLVHINDEQISYPSFPRRILTWDQLNNVVLKDGLLTIDCRNNRIIQQLIDPRAINTGTESEINELCRRSLAAANPK